MAYTFRGNTSTYAISDAKNLPMSISSFTLVNKAAAAITANVYMLSGVNIYNIAPASLAINQGEMYQGDNPVVMLATEQIKIQVSGSVDFNFYINNNQ